MPGGPGLSAVKAGYAGLTNPRGLTGAADEALSGADVFIGLSQPGAISAEGIRSMADGAIVFAMANPTPEVLPEEIEDCVAVIGTGRSDYPNQINNVLAFPGVFRGALDVHESEINEGMKLAAAQAIAAIVDPTSSRRTTSSRASSTARSRRRWQEPLPGGRGVGRGAAGEGDPGSRLSRTLVSPERRGRADRRGRERRGPRLRHAASARRAGRRRR